MGSTEPTRSALLIRPATSEDFGAITAIYRDAVLHGTGTFEIEPPTAAEMAARHARTMEGGYPYLVAARQGEVAGYAYAVAFRDRPAFRFTVEDSVYVLAEMRGQGVGRALLEALIVAATAAGCRQMVALIGDSANAASIELHARAGFTRTGIIPASGWKAGRWLDVVLMQRSLGAGAQTPP